jgi:DNA invertase Pin-like site-specific DNA recombinase
MKITPDHLARGAFIYVRQSTVDQLINNHESRLRQYGLADRARALGWTDVTVIDDDLGRSGSGVSRPGFERLLASICEGRVGAVFAIEASRLARKGRDWHTLIEFCGLVGTVIIEEDGTYEPRHPNDRLLLGMKGTMSDLELSLLRARSMEALKQKARRGELFFTVAVGYVKAGVTRSRWTPTCACAKRSGWSSPVLPRCKASVRYFCRYVQTECRCHTRIPRVPDNTSCCGSSQSIRRCAIFSPTRFMPALTLLAEPAAG